MNELKGGALEQQPAPHCGRSFLDDGAKNPVELGPALVGQPRQVLRLPVSIQCTEHHTGQPIHALFLSSYIHATGS
jgi:hypothetical protein